MTVALHPGVEHFQLWCPLASDAGQVQNTHDMVTVPGRSVWPLGHSAGIHFGHQFGRVI